MSHPLDAVVAAVQAASALLTIGRDPEDPENVEAHIYLLDNTAPISPALMAEILRRSADEIDPRMSPRSDEEIATPGTGDALHVPGVVPKPS